MHSRSKRSRRIEASEASEDQQQDERQSEQEQGLKESKPKFLCTRPLKLDEFQERHLNFYVRMIQILSDCSLLKIASFNETRYSEECVTAFYTNLKEDDNGNLVTKIKRKRVIVSKSDWGDFLGIPSDGEEFDKVDKVTVWKELTGVEYKNKRESNSMGFIKDPVLRLLFLIVGRNVVCKSQGSMSQWSEEELWLVWNCFHGRQVDVVDLMFNQMMAKKDNPPYPYANLITTYCVEHRYWSPDATFNHSTGKIIDMQSLAHMGFSEFKVQQKKPSRSRSARSEGSCSQGASSAEGFDVEAQVQSLTLEVRNLTVKQQDQEAEMCRLKELINNRFAMTNSMASSSSNVACSGFQAFSAHPNIFSTVGTGVQGSEDVYHPLSPAQPRDADVASADFTFNNLDFSADHTFNLQSLMED